MSSTQVLWSDADYAKLADWVGQHPHGVTVAEASKHFSGCGDIGARFSYMASRGIVRAERIPGQPGRVAKGDSMKRYFQIARVIVRDRMKGRTNKTALMIQPLDHPDAAIIAVQNPKLKRKPKVVVAPKAIMAPDPPVSVPPADSVRVFYNAAEKRLAVNGAGVSLQLFGVNLVLDIS